MKVKEILDFLGEKAPFDTCEEWDNVGLLVGSGYLPATRVLVALDVTDGAVEAAKAIGADLIVTHHPVIFRPISRLSADSMPYRLAAAGISVISAHTNLDKAVEGVNDTLAARLGLTDIEIAADGRIIRKRITHRSGQLAMDESIQNLLDNLHKVIVPFDR